MTLLEQIVRDKRGELGKTKVARPLKDLQTRIKDLPKPMGFGTALKKEGFGIIAEIKKKSPSMSEMIPANFHEAADAYRESPLVKAVSILTDWKYFGMTIEELQRLKREIGKPVLRKDFMIDEYQVWEARAFGADAILLMACVLNAEEMRRLSDLAVQLGMDVLFECHSTTEIAMIPPTAQICGINSREFKTGRKSFRYRASRLIGKLKLFEHFGMRDFSTDLAVFAQLIGALPKAAIKVAESGLKPDGIAGVRDLGFDCALIGTALLKSPHGVRRTLELFSDALKPRNAI